MNLASAWHVGPAHLKHHVFAVTSTHAFALQDTIRVGDVLAPWQPIAMLPQVQYPRGQQEGTGNGFQCLLLSLRAELGYARCTPDQPLLARRLARHRGWLHLTAAASLRL